MTIEDIKEVTEVFARAAARARSAGFDAVQIHAAHGYLLSQYLSPHFNKRKDDYGGNLENRARLSVQVTRKRSGRQSVLNFPYSSSSIPRTFFPAGLTVEDMIQAAAMLQEAGIDAIEMSGGTFLSGKNSPSRVGKQDPEAYYEAAASKFKVEGLGSPHAGGRHTYH